MTKVSVKLMMGRKGSLEKSMAEIVLGCLGFWQWNLDMSLLTPLTSSDGLHSSSLYAVSLPMYEYLSFLRGFGFEYEF